MTSLDEDVREHVNSSEEDISRREFAEKAGLGLGGLVLMACGSPTGPGDGGNGGNGGNKVSVDLRLRNLTRDGEPEASGSTTFHVGNETVDGDGRATVEVEPGQYEIFAENSDFFGDWDLVQVRGADRFDYVSQRDLEGVDTPVEVNGNMQVDVYKILRDDIEGLGYTIEDLGRIYEGSVSGIGSARFQADDRFQDPALVTWFDYEGSEVQPDPEVVDAAKNFFQEEGNNTLDFVFDSYFRNVEIQEGGSEPSVPHYRLRWKELDGRVGSGTPRHDDKVIQQADVVVEPRADKDSEIQILLTEMYQAAGPAGDLEGNLGDDIMTDGEFNPFAKRVGKILYHFEPDTPFDPANF